MLSAENKVIVRGCFEELFNQPNSAVADKIILSANSAKEVPGLPPGISQQKALVAIWHAAFPDLYFDVEDVAAEDDKVIIRWRATGTHQREFLNMAATGRQINISGLSIFRLTSDRIIDYWTVYDRLEMMHQLGLIPGA
jgi:predicted ester cyclase